MNDCYACDRLIAGCNVASAAMNGRFCWRRGVVVSGVRNERSSRTSGPVSTGMGDRLRAGIPSRYVTSQLGQLSLASLRGHLIEYQLRLG